MPPALSTAESIVKDNPWRLPLGYGMESLFFLYHSHCPNEVTTLEGADIIPDHSHNETFDLLITGGVLGLIFSLLLIVLAAYYVFKHIGLIKTGREKRLFSLLVRIGLIVGLGVSLILGKNLIFIGLGIPAGVILGLIAYVLYYGFRQQGSELDTESLPLSRILLIGVLCGIIAHFVEIQFGIGVTSTRLYFWACLALIGVLFIKLKNPFEAKEKSPSTSYFIIYGILVA